MLTLFSKPLLDSLRRGGLREALFLSAFCLLAACGTPDGAAPEPSASAPAADTADVRLALLGSTDCLPFCYAEQNGIYRRLGLRVEQRFSDAQADCDTALLGTADGAFVGTDTARFVRQGVQLSRLVSTAGHWELVAAPALRLRRLADLRLRAVGVARGTVEDAMLTEALRTAGLEPTAVVRPQIHSAKVRADMVVGGQIDATVLPEPYLSAAKRRGAKSLYVWKGGGERSGSVALRRDFVASDRGAEVAYLLRQAYAEAADSLNRQGPAAARRLLRRCFGLTPEEAAEVQVPHYPLPPSAKR